MSSSPGNPVRMFLALVVACGVGLIGYFYWVKTRTADPTVTELPEAGSQPSPRPQASGSGTSPEAEPGAVAEPLPVSELAPADTPSPGESGSRVSDAVGAAVSATRRVLFRHTATDRNYGKLAVANYPDVSHLRFVDDFSCQVLHFAAGVGICLTADRGVFTKYGADLFDAAFERTFHIDLQGIPSRCRVSPNGKLAVFTVFVTGHSYDSVDFSTQTLLIDTTSGETLGDLEEFDVIFDGRPFRAPDFNFWGVTFTPDSKNFYSTLSSNRKHYLVKGDIESRAVSVIRENVECPSLSPDGTRVAYKKRFLVEGRVFWKLHVLDLSSMRDTPLVEERSVDDQLAWLDNSRVLYTLPASQTGSSASTNVWMAPVDGGEPPKLFLTGAYSPAVVR